MLSDNVLGKIIIAEGLPGSGKSTWIERQFQELRRNNPCECYWEETSQPLDLFRQAVVPKQDMRRAINAFLQVSPVEGEDLLIWLDKHSYDLDEMMVVAYTRTVRDSAAIQRFAVGLRRYDLGDGRSTFEDYSRYHQRIWKRFAETVYDPHKVFLSEGALFHNQLFDLVGFYELTDQEICRYYRNMLKDFDTACLRIELMNVDDCDKLIMRTAAHRPGWQAQLDNWLRHAPWAIHGQYVGTEGVRVLYSRLQEIYRRLIDELGISVHIQTREFSEGPTNLVVS